MFVAFVLIVLVILVVYFVLHKSLRIIVLSQNFPGPRALPLIGNGHLLFGKKPEEFFLFALFLVKTYGDVFRLWLGPELNLMFSDVKSVEEIFGSRILLDKATEYGVLHKWLREGLLVSKGQKWFKRRKIITPAFHFQILEGYVEIFNGCSNTLVNILNGLKDGDGIHMMEYISTCTLDVICGKKWFKRRKIITPAFHFRILEQFIDVFDGQSNQLVKNLSKYTYKDNVDLYSHITLCALDVICGRKWFNRRKVITPAFHFRILEQFIDVFDAQSNQLVKNLSKYTQKDDVDLYTHVTHCALDVICETAMGVSCNAQINSDSKYVQAVKTLSMIVHKRMFDVQYRYEFLFRLTNLARTQKQALKVIHDFTNSVIVARRDQLLRSQVEQKSSEADENDNSIGAKKKMAFLDILLQSQIDGKPLSNADIQEEVDTFMFEGHDTTASAITFCLYNLACHPETQKKCFAEICEVIGKDKHKPIAYSDLNNLNYLECALKETLRLYPSVPLFGRKVLKECIINGKRIPAGTNIGVSPLVLGRKEELFPKANEFIPERFDSSMIMGGDKMNPYCYIPFSAGPRNCIGQKFAMLEAKSVVSKVLRHFEVEMIENQEEPILIAELILKTKNQLIFKLKPRVYA